jgi:hypothetical protein
MNVHLHIDRIVLENIDLSPRQRRHLQAVIEAELAHLLTTQGLPPNLNYSSRVPGLKVDVIALTGDNSPTSLGQQIAHTIYQGMGYQSMGYQGMGNQ